MDYVGKEEFNNLVKRVDKIEDKTEKIQDLMIKVDKKTDIILEKVKNSNNSEDLKLSPIITRIEALEDQQKWLWRTVVGAVILAVLGLVLIGG